MGKNKTDTITINAQSLDFIKKYFLKNNFVLVFNLLALFSLIFWLSNLLGISLKLNVLVSLTGLFSSGLWLFLGIAFIASGVLTYYEKYKLMFIPLLLWLLVTTALVRTSNMPDLVNAATGEPTLGPDLDPFLFLRNAYEIVEGKNLGKTDLMRYAPLGAPSYLYTSMMPWAIVGIYKIMNLFGQYSVTEAAIISPVIFFLVSVVGFFLFVYVLFSFKLSEKKALIGATFASFFYAFVPIMLHRTTAGIPELESLGMVWFWFAFLFFALAWKQDLTKDQENWKKTRRKIVIYGLLAGLFAGAMSWTWGGYRYVYMILGLASFLAFLFNIEKKKNLMVLGSFLFTGLIIEIAKVKSVLPVILSFNDIGLAFGVLLMIGINYVIFETKLKNSAIIKGIKEKIKLPENILSILIFVVIGFLFLLIIQPEFILNLFSRIIEGLLYPFGRGRIGLTVAENRAPYFVEVLGNFGSIVWLFLAGLVLIFYEAVKHFSSKKKLVLIFFFILFVATFVFSRISSGHMLDGENLISRIMYLGGLIVFGLVLLTVYIKSWSKKDEKTIGDFSKINIASIILISFSFWAIVSMRGAVRLFFIIAPIIIMIASFFVIKICDYRKTKDDLGRLFVWILIIVSLIMAGNVFLNYSQSTISSAQYLSPSPYNQQWHYAMHWVEENTPEDAIFTHWWDYGYWVQTLGKRPTVSDGGHFTSWWDHTVGRYLLTTPKPETALSLMKTHNVSYLLIDSTDVGKYPAFSGIGSDETGKDRRSWIPVMPLEPSQTYESNNITRILFAGGTAIDSDIIYIADDGRQIFLPAEKAGLAGIIIEYSMKNEEIIFFKAQGIFFYNNQRYDLPLRYVYYDGKISDFGSGVESLVRIIPGVSQTAQGISINQLGAAIYLSEKTKDSLFSQLYLMDDINSKYPTINLVHAEDDFVVKSLKQQGLDLGHFLYYQGLRGPIKIWEVDYPENIIVRDEFLWLINPEGNWGALDNLEFTK